MHVKRVGAKTKEATNAAWGVMKRASIGDFSRRLCLMQTLSKSGFLYGEEIWGWEEFPGMEKIQGKITKVAIELNGNALVYIWRMEAGKMSIGIESIRRVAEYVLHVYQMSNDR